MRTNWNAEAIELALKEIIDKLGHMPSASDMRREGRNDLACAISRRGGFAFWQKMLKVQPKPSCSAARRSIELLATEMLRKRGYRVPPPTTQKEFDLLMNRKVKVDVKSGRYHGAAGGYVFGLAKVPATCDLYLLAPMDEDGAPLGWYFIPSRVAQVQTITLTRNGKYEHYRDNFEALNRILIP